MNLWKSKPEALWRLARFEGLTNPKCRCDKCMTALVEWLARQLDNPEPP